jgi:hydroxymethylglutaryl-CoA reductase
LATWQWDAEDQILKGQIALPLVVGIVGKFRTSLAVQSAFKLAGIDRYETLCGILAAVGLAQNFGALWALVTEGIQSGHMRLHARK